MKFSIKTLLYLKKFSYFETEKLVEIAKSLAGVSGICLSSENPVSETSKC